MGTLVDAGAIPYTNVDVEAIRSGASSLKSAAGEVRSGGAAVVSAWRPISGVYRGPGDAQLFAAMDPVGQSSTAFGDDLDRVAGALGSFADQVEPIVAKLKALHADALALGGKVAAFKPHETWSWMALGEVSVDSWDQDEGLNNENNRIINGVADQMVEYEAAERACANTIRSIAGLPPLHALTGAKDDPLGYGYSAIPAGTKLPWGQSADREESCSEKTATFLPSLFKGIVVDGVGGTLAGLGQMVGISVHDWKFSWSWDTVTTTWGAMGSLISYNPQTGQWGDWSGAGDAWTNLGKGTIAWDEWAKDPGAAAGATIFNVGSLLIPVVGEVGKVGAVGRVGEAAGDASKLSKLAAIGDLTDPVSLVAKGVHLALPKLSDLVSALGSKFDDLKGLVSDHMPNFKDGSFHFEGSHVEPEVPAGRPEPAAPHIDQPVVEPAHVGGVHGETGHVVDGSGAHSGGSGGHGGGDLGSGGGHSTGSGGADGHAGDTPGEPARTPDERPALPQDYPRPEAHHEVTVTGRDVPGSRTPFAQRTDLEPNTMYHVEGRGDFYTDAHGHVTYVETTYGGKGNLNADLMRPQPDTTYVVHPDVTNPVDGARHAHVFHTDSLGRTDYAHTDQLAEGEADRSPSVQARVGKLGGDGYEGGHFLGTSYGGGGEQLNIVPMLEGVNRGAGETYFNLENQWRAILRDDPTTRIMVDIRPQYVDGLDAPVRFKVTFRINDGRPQVRVFNNG